MTGTEFDNIFSRKIDKSYSGYLNTIKKTELFKEALYTSIEDKYKLENDADYDAIISVIRTNQIFAINGNKILTSDLNIFGVTNVGILVRVETTLPHNLISAQSFTTSGIAGITNVNGTFTVAAVLSPVRFTFISALVPAGAHTANTGIVTNSKLISDYMHLLAVKAKYVQSILTVRISGATNASPIVLTLNAKTNLRSGEQIEIAGVLGNTNANGVYYIQKLSSVKFALYSDSKLTIPVVGNAAYTAGGTISRIFYEYCQPLYSNRKINPYVSEISVDRPKFERGDNVIKFSPVDETCSEITIDYISDTTRLIDPTDTAIDLENYYPHRFLIYVTETAMRLFEEDVKEELGIQIASAETK